MTNHARPQTVTGSTQRIRTTECGTLYVTVNSWDGKVQEIFFDLGKAGGCSRSWSQAVGKLVSLALQAGLPVETIIEALKDNRCDKITWGGDKGHAVLSCADGVAKCIQKALGTEITVEEDEHGENIPQ